MKHPLLTICLIVFALPSWGNNLVCKYTGFICIVIYLPILVTVNLRVDQWVDNLCLLTHLLG